MINAELKYNPYLLVSSALFNGEEPRINSEIEQYKHKPLYEWIHRIPAIFYNEMNGYDFEFYFTGSRSDYEKIDSVFKGKGISDEQVHVVLKNELESPKEKEAKILDLLSWMKENPNEFLNPNCIEQRNIEILDPMNNVLFLRGNGQLQSTEGISLEEAENAKQIAEMDLQDLPIIFYTERDTIDDLAQDLNILRYRTDVTDDQLFFLFSDDSDPIRTERFLKDLGLYEIQRLNSLQDSRLTSYIRDHAQTARIHQFILFLEKHVQTMVDKQNQARRVFPVENKGNMERIKELDQKVSTLKALIHALSQDDIYRPGKELETAKVQLLTSVQNFSRNKMKLKGHTEIEKFASNFQQTLFNAQSAFSEAVYDITKKEMEEIESHIKSIYTEAECDISWQDSISKPVLPQPSFPYIKDTLLKMTGTVMETRNDLFNNEFFNLGKIGIGPNKVPEKVEVQTADLEIWRQYASEQLQKSASSLMEQSAALCMEYYEASQKTCLDTMEKQLEKAKDSRGQYQNQLSDQEQVLERNQNWLEEIQDRLFQIEED